MACFAALAATAAAFILGLAAAGVQCDEDCYGNGKWWHVSDASEWTVQWALAAGGLVATLVAVVALASGRRRASIVFWLLALVLDTAWAKLLLVDASYLG